jgi:hypothetical protein
MQVFFSAIRKEFPKRLDSPVSPLGDPELFSLGDPEPIVSAMPGSHSAGRSFWLPKSLSGC